jgi:hypothetical protein
VVDRSPGDRHRRRIVNGHRSSTDTEVWLTRVRSSFGYGKSSWLPEESRAGFQGQLDRKLSAAYRVDLEQVDLRTNTVMDTASTGRRTIAFEHSVLPAWCPGVVPGRSLVAIAAQELAHLRHRNQRGALALFWLALPWTMVQTVVGAVPGGCCRGGCGSPD